MRFTRHCKQHGLSELLRSCHSHLYLKSIGLGSAQMHEDSIDPIVYRIKIDYKSL